MSFERPELLPLLPMALLLVTGAVLWRWRRGVRLVRAYGGREAATRLTGRSALDAFPALRLLSVVLGLSALLLAAAGAGPGDEEPPVPPTPLDLVIALDISHSMTATDVAPRRMERAKAAAQALVDARVADRVAVTTFAAWPYALVPVTEDASVADYFLPWIEPGLVDDRHQGTALAAVVEEAVQTLEARPRPDAVPVLVLVTDGEAHGTAPAVVEAAEAAASAGIRIWTAGVGTPEGAPLFVSRRSTAPLLGGSGGQVTAGYDPGLLQDVARIGGGGFHEIGSDAGIDALVADLLSLRGGAGDVEEGSADPTGVLVLLGLLLLLLDAALDAGLLERRRRAAA